jgi:hypothetical protein
LNWTVAGISDCLRIEFLDRKIFRDAPKLERPATVQSSVGA